MAQVIPFRGALCKALFEDQNYSTPIPLSPDDDQRPLLIVIAGETAGNIRIESRKFGKTPSQFVRAWLKAGFSFPERPT